MKQKDQDEEKLDEKALIAKAVQTAVDACIVGIDEKIQAAINLGITIGAEVGAKVGTQIGAEAGAAAALKAAEKEMRNHRKQQYNWKYHNTKLLLRNYRRLNEYYQNAVFDEEKAEETDEGFEEVLRIMSGKDTDEKIVVESIQRNYAATRIIMTHVNKMLGCYKGLCLRSGRPDDARHWRVLEGLYLSGEYTTAEEIAEQEGIDKRTVYRDIDICASELTTLFFGIGGIEDA